jgi:hypothetical protein
MHDGWISRDDLGGRYPSVFFQVRVDDEVLIIDGSRGWYLVRLFSHRDDKLWFTI